MNPDSPAGSQPTTYTNSHTLELTTCADLHASQLTAYELLEKIGVFPMRSRAEVESFDCQLTSDNDLNRQVVSVIFVNDVSRVSSFQIIFIQYKYCCSLKQYDGKTQRARDQKLSVLYYANYFMLAVKKNFISSGLRKPNYIR